MAKGASGDKGRGQIGVRGEGEGGVWDVVRVSAMVEVGHMLVQFEDIFFGSRYLWYGASCGKI